MVAVAVLKVAIWFRVSCEEFSSKAEKPSDPGAFFLSLLVMFISTRVRLDVNRSAETQLDSSPSSRGGEMISVSQCTSPLLG